MLRHGCLRTFKFYHRWSRGAPVVLTQVTLQGTWDPTYFIKYHGGKSVTVINCKTQATKTISVADFMGMFGKPVANGEVWKLKV